MGKRKSKQVAPKKPKKVVAKIFDCPFCNHKASVSAKLDKQNLIGTLKCRMCAASFETRIEKWVDQCEQLEIKEEEERKRREEAGEFSQEDDQDDYRGGGRSAAAASAQPGDRLLGYDDDDEDDDDDLLAPVLGEGGGDVDEPSAKRQKQQDAEASGGAAGESAAAAPAASVDGATGSAHPEAIPASSLPAAVSGSVVAPTEHNLDLGSESDSSGDA